jgi:uncharacterized protein YaeQ
MAIAATLYRFDVELSDVDRDTYAQLELRPALHPSETMPYMLTRVLAFCLSHEEGIAFSHGLAAADEPALWIKDLQGNLRAWIEVGSPSAERLHKASKAVERVVVFTHHDVANLQKALRGKKLHRAEAIELYAIDPAFLTELESLTERSNRWTVARSEGELYLTVKDRTLASRVERHPLAGLG